MAKSRKIAEKAREQRENFLEDVGSLAEDVHDRLDSLETEFLEFAEKHKLLPLRDATVPLIRGHWGRWKCAGKALSRAIDAFYALKDEIDAENDRRWKRGGHA